jgi:hypothetical protein
MADDDFNDVYDFFVAELRDLGRRTDRMSRELRFRAFFAALYALGREEQTSHEMLRRLHQTLGELLEADDPAATIEGWAKGPTPH